MVAAALLGSGPLARPESGAHRGTISKIDPTPAYVEHLMGYVNPSALSPLRVVANGGDGMAGPLVEILRDRLPLEFFPMHMVPDGTFPRGVPNPLLPENRAVTADAVIKEKADLGLAWDGDCDRCFFFDENGAFIEGYYLVGLLAQEALKDHPGGRIVHDPRLVWNTIEMVKEAGGIPIMHKSGHAFIKERMRREDALYGGEMSAHHYFRRFAYCDSGMIPWLLVASLMSRTGKRPYPRWLAIAWPVSR